MLSGRGLCDELIARPEESYQLQCVVVCDLETSRICTPYIYDISSLRVNKSYYIFPFDQFIQFFIGFNSPQTVFFFCWSKDFSQYFSFKYHEFLSIFYLKPITNKHTFDIYTYSLTSLLHVSVLSKLFGRKSEGVTGNWRRPREAQLTKCYSGDQIGETEIGGTCGTYGGEVYTGLWCGRFRAKRPLGSPRSRQENNRGMD